MVGRGGLEPCKAGGRAIGSSGPSHKDSRQTQDGVPPLRVGETEGLMGDGDDWTAGVAEC